MKRESTTAETAVFSFETATFVRDYLPVFRSNFSQFCNDAVVAPQLPVSTELYAEKLYLAMFGGASPASNAVLEQTIREFVLSTLEAEPVLLKAWMRMINDYVDVLEASSSSTALLLELVNWIDMISMTLYHSYFRISQESQADDNGWTAERIGKSAEIARGYVRLVPPPDQSESIPGQPIPAYAYFRGIPDRFECRVVKVRDDTVTYRVEARHVAVLSRIDHVSITAADGQTQLLAEVKSAAGDHVVLHHFQPFAGRKDRREQVRVEPREPIDIWIDHTAGHSRGTILDLSESGVAIYLRNTGVDVSTQVQVRFSVPLLKAADNRVDIHCNAIVSNIRPDPRGDSRAHVVVLEFEHNTAIKDRLSSYVACRQTEILKEIRHIMEGRA